MLISNKNGSFHMQKKKIIFLLKPNFEKVGDILDSPCPSFFLSFILSVILSFHYNSVFAQYLKNEWTD